MRGAVLVVGVLLVGCGPEQKDPPPPTVQDYLGHYEGPSKNEASANGCDDSFIRDYRAALDLSLDSAGRLVLDDGQSDFIGGVTADGWFAVELNYDNGPGEFGYFYVDGHMNGLHMRATSFFTGRHNDTPCWNVRTLLLDKR
jgi:hypothetical protein